MCRFDVALPRFFAAAFFAALLVSVCSSRAHAVRVARSADQAAPDYATPDPASQTELFRLRIVNRKEGAIQVSTDYGASWRLVGRVLAPATTAAEGYTAAQYARPGTVAAIAVHGIRIRVGRDDPTLHDPLVLSIDPVEFGGVDAQDPNKGYGGQVTGSAGILTDIHAGTAIFRELSPRVGSQVSLERLGGDIRPLESGFRPTGQGETLVITVTAPKISLTQVIFQNRAGGDVTATWSDGTSRVITHVVQPVVGVGRFDGTAYTGLGRLNTDHTGVITVSTAPIDLTGVEGEGKERRGGFQISPAWHNARLEEAGAPIVMTLGEPATGTTTHTFQRELEGIPPLFRDAVSLGDDDAQTSTVDVSIDDAPFEPMPSLIGNRPDAFLAAGLAKMWGEQGIMRTAVSGVTAFRLRLAPWDGPRARNAADLAVSRCCLARYNVAVAGRLPIVRGVVAINANPTNSERVAYVRLLVEGDPRGFTNVAPYSLTWNTFTVPDGEYLVEADALDEEGRLLATTRHKVFVLNHAPPAKPIAALGTSAGN